MLLRTPYGLMERQITLLEPQAVQGIDARSQLAGGIKRSMLVRKYCILHRLWERMILQFSGILQTSLIFILMAVVAAI